MEEFFKIVPVGVIRRKAQSVSVEIYEKYRDALQGLDEYTHILVLIWFHESDSKTQRRTLQIHPMGNEDNPLTGVFATRSPVRPNPVALFTCRIIDIEGRIIHVEKIDAFDGSPVIDVKPYITRIDSIAQARGPKLRKPSWKGVKAK